MSEPDKKNPTPKRVCCGCGHNKKVSSFSKVQWLEDDPICKLCNRGNSKQKTQIKLKIQRRDVARQFYCHRWENGVLGGNLLKTCRRYLDSCAAHCYEEDENEQPNCFIEPEQDSEKKMIALSYETPMRVPTQPWYLWY